MPTLQPASKTILDAEDSRFGIRSERLESDIFATSTQRRLEQNKLWDDLINYKLIEWGLASKSTDEDGLVPPTDAAVLKACNVAVVMYKQGLPVPTGVIPDGEGGVVFEYRFDPSYVRLEIEDDGSTYWVTFNDCTFQSRDCVEIAD